MIKKLVFLGLVSGLMMLVSCKGEDHTEDFNKKILGTWQLVKVQEQFQVNKGDEPTTISEDITDGFLITFSKNKQLTKVYSEDEDPESFSGTWRINNVVLSMTIADEGTFAYDLLFMSDTELQWRIDSKEGYEEYHYVMTLRKK